MYQQKTFFPKHVVKLKIGILYLKLAVTFLLSKTLVMSYLKICLRLRQKNQCLM